MMSAKTVVDLKGVHKDASRRVMFEAPRAECVRGARL